jgi:hypothetical protein
MVTSGLTFEPPRREISARAETVFEAVLPVTEDFEPGKTYFATLTAEGVEAMSILLRLTVEPALDAEEPAISPSAATADDVAAAKPKAVSAPAKAEPAPAASKARVAAKGKSAAKPPVGRTGKATPAKVSGARPKAAPKARA